MRMHKSHEVVLEAAIMHKPKQPRAWLHDSSGGGGEVDAGVLVLPASGWGPQALGPSGPHPTSQGQVGGGGGGGGGGRGRSLVVVTVSDISTAVLHRAKKQLNKQS